MKIEVQNLSFGYSKAQMVINPMSFSVATSETIAIVGSSGCGKSTLLRLICGLLPGTGTQTIEGSILINGRDILVDKPHWRNLRSGGKVGFMFQDACLLPNMSVAQNIHLPLRILRQTGVGPELVSDYLRRTGLEQEKHKFPSQLSGGMKTRVALARTFISGPELLLLDEPFTGLDIVWKAKLYTELLSLKRKQQSTVILVTHDIFEAIFFSSRILIMGEQCTLGEVSIPNWQATHTYDEVVTRHHDAFVQIRALIESSQQGAYR